ncbi:Bax inhibitor-1/YccA family protein [Saccharicrinis sp. FJH62]|uniref:Bax inhibitor-1/YccA family protein n=1 Tax=Saccharicrinis sp. FJH62 TaxID=3344657 RepID=UPI0035D3EF1E
MTQNQLSYTGEFEVAAEQQRFITKVYGWMTFALAITGLIAMWISSTPQIVNVIAGNRFLFFGLLIGELVLVGSLASMVQRISAQLATLLFVLYAVLNGLTFSVIFLLFTTESIASTFLITAGTFGVMSFYGYVTKSDLTRMGNLLFMALIGLIIASVVNFFFQNEMLYWITTYAGVFIFVGLVAYDTQKIKKMNIIGNEGTEEDKKEAIMGALTLYLDFINLFLFLLRIFGRRR